MSAKMVGLTEELLEEIRDIARRNRMKKVILFGSRARGDYHRTSDIDLAVIGGASAAFTFDVDEETHTLLKYDVIDLMKPVSRELCQSIEREGFLIYTLSGTPESMPSGQSHFVREGMKKFENFINALNNLKDVQLEEEPYDNITLTGMVALYGICFEQAWKAMKETMQASGMESFATGSPRSIIKEAYKEGMISEEDLWLEALASRNDVAHAYNKEIALDIVKKTKRQYIIMFEKLRESIERNWLE